MKSQDPILKSTKGAISRRSFLRNTALAAAAAIGAPAIVRGQNLNSLLDIAMIGCGGRGGGNLQEVRGENIVALCDVNAKNVDAVATQFPKAEKFSDFRKMYDKLKSYDAVVVSTCEHTHAFATLPALKLGKHVYCEKPLAHNVWEARIIREAANKAKVATQMGTQIHAGNNYRRVVELVQSGSIGPVREVHVWVNRRWGWQASEEESKIEPADIVFSHDRPTAVDPVPAGLDWELWLGPAPKRPFNNMYFPGPKWYRWWEWGSGTMSDLGSHWIDLPFWALNLQHPLTIEAGGPPAHPEIAPASMWAKYEYAARKDMPALTLTWYQGKEKPAIWKEDRIPKWENGVLFIGDKGMLLADYGKLKLLPEDKFKDFAPPPQTIPESIGHHKEWINACKTGAPTTCNFEYAGWLTEANHLGNVAYRTGKKLDWDPVKLKATNAPEAAKFIKRKYRKPFVFHA
jgi:hypothetical protein